jgi:spore maturation protein CgeB
MTQGLRIAFFGSRYEPDAFNRQDIPAPAYARSVVYPAHNHTGVRAALADAGDADVVVKASGVGVFDALLEQEVLALQGPNTRVVFWDVDAPATLDRVQQHADDPFRQCIPAYDLILTYGGGTPVVNAYEALGAPPGVHGSYGAFPVEARRPMPRCCQAWARRRAPMVLLVLYRHGVRPYQRLQSGTLPTRNGPLPQGSVPTVS